jgi:Zn-dependent protease
MEQGFFSWGLPIGQVAGIRIRLHWLLLLLWAFDINEAITRSDTWGGNAFLYWLLGTAICFGVILLHEFGHCFAARAVGGAANEVLLWPLGGLAFCTAPNVWHAQLIVAAGGPAVNVVIAAAAYSAFWLAALASPAETWSPYLWYCDYALTRWNLILLVFNLIPLYPLDGGRILHAGLWGLFRRRGGGGHVPWAFPRATIATVWASRVTAALGVCVAIYPLRDLRLIVLFAWAWAEAENLRRSLHEGLEEDYSFGYDFSRGYTSLGEPQRHVKRGPSRAGAVLGRLFGRRRGRTPAAAAAAEERRVDELLAKIQRDGVHSLTRGERRFLEKVSRRRQRPE